MKVSNLQLSLMISQSNHQLQRKHLDLFDGDVGAESGDDGDAVELLQDLLHEQALQHLRVPHIEEQSGSKKV